MTEEELRSGGTEEAKQKIRLRYQGVSRDELEFIPAKSASKLYDENETDKLVAAYCRVSTGDIHQTTSYELQRNYYEDKIKANPHWHMVDVYADEGISGTSLQHRDEFNRMIKDCEAGKIDLIMTKSVSRFARNVVDCISLVRSLKALPHKVGVLFETEGIYTLDGGTSEMMLAVLAAAAQEESHNKSDIMNQSIEMRFSRGIFLTPELLGFDRDEDGNLVVNDDEAETVRLVYDMYLGGFPTSDIASVMTKLGRHTGYAKQTNKKNAGDNVPPVYNTKWSQSSVTNVIKNERYCGAVLSRKTFTPDYLNHKSKINHMDRNQYRQSDHHEAIVSNEVYGAANRLYAIRKASHLGKTVPSMRVIDDGPLRGFVSVDRRWAGFTARDYIDAANSTPKTPSRTKRNDNAVLPGFQVVRGEYFNDPDSMSMTISRGQISFNRQCVEMFGDSEHVELLFNPVDKCMAIRPVGKDSPNALCWATLRDNKWVIKKSSCRGFFGAASEIMGWDGEQRYRFKGRYRKLGKEKLLIFELESGVSIETLKCDGKKQNIVHYQGEDADFGYREIEEKYCLVPEAYKGDWGVLTSMRTFKTGNGYTDEERNLFLEKARTIIERMKSNGGGDSGSGRTADTDSIRTESIRA